MKVYIAGPEVFLKDNDVLARKRDMCMEYGFEPLLPFVASRSDDNIKEWYGQNSVAGRVQAGYIYANNTHFIDECDALIANLTPFRGPSADVGTVFEIGYAKGKNKIILAYTNTTFEYAKRVRGQLGLALSTCIDWDGIEIEDFGLVDNLMVDYAFKIGQRNPVDIEKFEGQGMDRVQQLTDLTAFKRCLKHLFSHY